MDEHTQRIKNIGRALRTRRISFDPANHHDRTGWMETVEATTNVRKRTIIGVETGERANYTETTLTALETTYRLYPGTLGPALNGTGQLITDDGELLYPGPGTEPVRLPEPDPSEERARRLVHDLKDAVSHLPEEDADRVLGEALAAAEAQARLVVDAAMHRMRHGRSEQFREQAVCLNAVMQRSGLHEACPPNHQPRVERCSAAIEESLRPAGPITPAHPAVAPHTSRAPSPCGPATPDAREDRRHPARG